MGIIHKNIGQGSHFEWPDLAIKRYEGDGVRGTRRILVGPDDGAERFVMRYFEIGPGASSSLDHHAHDHGVFVLRGRARLRLGGELEEVSYGDAIYIAPFEEHQFENLGEEPFGFLCVISRPGGLLTVA